MIKKILVPTDGSKTAEKAVHYAAELAHQAGASVMILAVIDTSYFAASTVSSGVTPTRMKETVEDVLRQAAEAYTEKAEQVCRKRGVRSRRIIRPGHPVEKIVKEAEKSKADLIVMGSHGKSALKAAVLGSTTYGVIHKHTKVPVLVVRR
jgi:nucleotide-binding universal stress UspA family protein